MQCTSYRAEQHRSPESAPSPTLIQMAQDKVHGDRAALFVQGRHKDLLTQLGKVDRE